MSVDYNLNELSKDRFLKNYFHEAVDVHTDLWIDLSNRCNLVRENDVVVAAYYK